MSNRRASAGSMSSSFMDEIRKIPPVTRFLVGSTMGVSMSIMLGLVSAYDVIFVKEYVIRHFQIWRPFTSMFIAGEKLNFLFNIVMLYRNADHLESGQYAGQSADLAWQLFLNGCGILALNLPLHSVVHFRPLFLSLVMLSAQLSPDALTSIFGLFTLKNQYFPYALVVLDFVTLGAGAAVNGITGLISGYAWWYVVHSADSGRPGAEFARAPAWMRWLLGEGSRVVPGVGRVINNAASRTTAAGRGARNGTVGYNWGSGNRLGDN